MKIEIKKTSPDQSNPSSHCLVCLTPLLTKQEMAADTCSQCQGGGWKKLEDKAWLAYSVCLLGLTGAVLLVVRAWKGMEGMR